METHRCFAHPGLLYRGERQCWIASGGAAKARILATTGGGDSWNAYDTPIVQGTASSGGVSVAFRDCPHGILGGGELAVQQMWWEPEGGTAEWRNGERAKRR